MQRNIRNMNELLDALPPLSTLLSSYAGPDTARHRAIWRFDGRLAHLARTTTEPMIGQMRLAWWNDVIDDADQRKGQGEPVVDALRASGAMAAAGLGMMLDGWEVLVVEQDLGAAELRDFAAGRGGGLFRALAGTGEAPEWLAQAGQVWALWDLAGHVGDAVLAAAAITLARETIPAGTGPWPSEWKPLRIAYTLARQDVLKNRGAPAGMPRGLALRLLRIALVGR